MNTKQENFVDLTARLEALEKDIVSMVQAELSRIKRIVILEELRDATFDRNFEPDFQCVKLADDGQVWVDTCFNEDAEVALAELLCSDIMGHWKAIDMLGLLIGASQNRYRTYVLKGKNGNEDIFFGIKDLIPVYHNKRQNYDTLVNLADHSAYDADWDQPMGAEYKMLYNIDEKRGVDFFRISGTGLIVIPGTYIYPTGLSEIEVINQF